MSDDTRSDEQQKKAEAAPVTTSTPKNWSDDEVRKIIEDRDKAKEKARKYDEEKKKAEESKAIEEGRLKEVLIQKEAELSEMRKKAEAFEMQQQKLRESIINKLPDDDKELVADIKDIDKLQKFVDKLTKTPQPPAKDQKFQLGGTQGKPKFKNAEENARWLKENGLAV